jgi:dihydroorotate dehydrogenase
MRRVLYRAIRPLLYALPPETAHELAAFALEHSRHVPLAHAALRAFRVEDERLAIDALGHRFANPLGIAAGFDKDARMYDALGALGFGHVEVGTITGEPQPGNDKPRLFRLVADRALVNRMGFNNRGSAGAVARVDRPRSIVLGINIGKTKAVEEAGAIDDYVKSAERLGPHADYLVVNVSSPNTPGLRNLQTTAKLEPLLRAVRATLDRVGRRVPLLVKIAPDLADADVLAIADLALALGLDGIVATNTTISREGLATPAGEIARIGSGGLSGAPLAARSTAVLALLSRRVGRRLTLIAAGGVSTAQDAWKRIRLGASLVQVYTAFIYEGPFLARALARGLLELAERDGFRRVSDAIGVDRTEAESVAPAI